MSSAMDYDLKELVSQVHLAYLDKNINSSMNREMLIMKQLTDLRNTGKPLYSNMMEGGILYGKTTNFRDNEKKFNDLWKCIYQTHVSMISDDVLSRWNGWINDMILKIDSSPLWYELTEEQVKQSAIYPFRIADIEHYNNRLQDFLYRESDSQSAYVKPMNVFCLSSEYGDAFINLRNDLSFDKYTKSSKLNYLKSRVKENNPFYDTHPLELLLVTVIILKAICPTFICPGILYLNSLMVHINKCDEYQFHFPIEFKSDGTLVSSQYHSHILLHFKVILNRMSLLIINADVHNFNSNYISVSNEIFCYILSNGVIEGGKSIKSDFSIINLYYGMDLKKCSNEEHLHPKYVDDFPYSQTNPRTFGDFSPTLDCYECKPHGLNRAVYSLTIRNAINDSIKALLKKGLKNFSIFITEKLLGYSRNKKIIHDLIFIRIHLNMGGYSHTHQLADFSKQIENNLNNNKEYKMNLGDADCKNNWVLHDMFQAGANTTRWLIDRQRYPTAKGFKESISKYITSKSSGLMPIDVKFDFVDSKYNRKVKMTSKNANLMVTGRDALNIENIVMSTIPEEEFKLLLTDKQLEAYKVGTLSEHFICKYRGISRIGARATVAYRDIRPIYINPFPMHLMQAIILGPHVEHSNKLIRNAQISSIFLNSHDMGNSISTMFQDGTLDLVSHAVMAFSSKKYITVCADCSAWDQHFVTPIINAYLKGVKKVFLENKQLFINEHYMYKGADAVPIWDIVDYLIQAQDNRQYVASYLGENIVYPVDFMTSGALYTFYLNSVLNTIINEKISSRIGHLGCTYVSVMNAGDDSLSLMEVPPTLKANTLEMIKKVVTETYEEANQKTNTIKSSTTIDGGEFAKIYWYCGMVFRDPSIQLFESEKESKSESYIDKVRGFSQKMFEATRRSVGDLKINMLYCRLALAMSYKFSTFLYDPRLSKRFIVKYYPPFISIVAPSSIKGGLGFSISGVSLNEVLLIVNHLKDEINSSLSVLENLNYDTERGIIDSIFSYYFPDISKQFIEPQSKYSLSGLKVKNVSLSSDDPLINAGDFRKGVIFQQESIDILKTNNANLAMRYLSSHDIPLRKRHAYINTSYTSLYDALGQLSVTKEAVRNSISKNISRLFNVTPSNVTLRKLKVSKIENKYSVYTAFSFRLREADYAPQQRSLRYISASNISYLLEQKYGSRTVNHFSNNIRSSNQAMFTFIKDTGRPMVESQLMDIILESQVLYDDNYKESLTQLLTAIGGDVHAAEILANSLVNEKVSWENELISMHVRGTMLENININDYLVSNSVHMDGNFPQKLVKLMKTLSFIYAIQYGAFVGSLSYNGLVSITPKSIELLEKLTKGALTQHKLLIHRLMHDSMFAKDQYMNYYRNERNVI